MVTTGCLSLFAMSKRNRTPSDAGQTTKVSRASTSTPHILCSLPPTCNPPHNTPTPLASSTELEAHYATYHAHVCQQCRAVFPDPRLLDLVSARHFSSLHPLTPPISTKQNVMTPSQPCAKREARKSCVPSHPRSSAWPSYLQFLVCMSPDILSTHVPHPQSPSTPPHPIPRISKAVLLCRHQQGHWWSPQALGRRRQHDPRSVETQRTTHLRPRPRSSPHLHRRQQ